MFKKKLNKQKKKPSNKVHRAVELAEVKEPVFHTGIHVHSIFSSGDGVLMLMTQ